MKIPYERIIQWSAGPLSIAAGFIATLVVGGPHSTDHTQVATAIDHVGVFGVSAAVAYLAHAKWLSNLTRWWEVELRKQDAAVPTDADLDVGPAPETSADPGDPIPAAAIKNAGFPLADQSHLPPPIAS